MRAVSVGVAATWTVLTVMLTPKLGVGQEPSELRTKADAVRATAAELRFTRIPWVTDVFEGFRLAREEKRPVFLYMITGDPLGDC